MHRCRSMTERGNAPPLEWDASILPLHGEAPTELYRQVKPTERDE